MRIEAKTLKTMVDVAARAADRRASMPILGNVAIEATGGKLTLRATDLYVHATVTAPCAGDCAPVAVEAARLKALLAGAKKGATADVQATFSTATHNETTSNDAGETVVEAVTTTLAAATVDLDGREARLVATPGADFPKAPEVCGAAEVIYDVDALASALAYVLPAVGRDDTRAHMNGIGFEGGYVLATDGHRLFAANSLPSVGALKAPVPLRGVALVAETMRAIKATFAGVRFTPGYAIFMLAGAAVEAVIHVKLVDAAFPPWTQIVPKRDDRTLSVNAARLREACEAAVRFAPKGRGESGGAIRLTMGAAALAQDGARPIVTIAYDVPEAGECSERIACDAATGPALTIGVNARYLAEACAGTDGNVRIGLCGELDPVRVEYAGRVGVIMPMRV